MDEAVKPLLVPGGGPPRGVVSRPGDLIRDVESSGTWMTLLNVEQDHAYRDLMEECLEDLAPFAQRFAGDIRRPPGFIFVSSPNSVTPAHFDIEHSIPMQIQGERRWASACSRRPPTRSASRALLVGIARPHRGDAG